MTVTAE